MAAQSTLRWEIRKPSLWFARLQMVAARIPAVFLLGSLLVAHAAAQDAAESNIGQDSRAHPAPSSQGAPKVTEKPKKKISKYDVDRIGQRGIGKGVNVYSLEEERDLARQLSAQSEMMTKLITDPVIRKYVNWLGQAIVRNSNAQVPFTTKVVESDEISALALPGGYLYVNSGLILATDSEAELAGLMAHEVAHVAARHATRAETRMQIWNVLSIALMYWPSRCIFHRSPKQTA
jgi:beta-barrel assembly-enhancing protease